MNREANLSEPDLKDQLLAEEAWRTGEQQKRLDAKTKELELVMKDLKAKELVVKERDHDKPTLEIELKAASGAIRQGETVIHDSAERICTG